MVNQKNSKLKILLHICLLFFVTIVFISIFSLYYHYNNMSDFDIIIFKAKYFYLLNDRDGCINLFYSLDDYYKYLFIIYADENMLIQKFDMANIANAYMEDFNTKVIEPLDIQQTGFNIDRTIWYKIMSLVITIVKIVSPVVWVSCAYNGFLVGDSFGKEVTHELYTKGGLKVKLLRRLNRFWARMNKEELENHPRHIKSGTKDVAQNMAENAYENDTEITDEVAIVCYRPILKKNYEWEPNTFDKILSFFDWLDGPIKYLDETGLIWFIPILYIIIVYILKRKFPM